MVFHAAAIIKIPNNASKRRLIGGLAKANFFASRRIAVGVTSMFCAQEGCRKTLFFNFRFSRVMGWSGNFKEQNFEIRNYFLKRGSTEPLYDQGEVTFL
jgi:hypothetical protein